MKSVCTVESSYIRVKDGPQLSVRIADINPIHNSVAIDHQLMPCSGLNNLLVNLVVRMTPIFPQCRPHPTCLLEEGLGDEPVRLNYAIVTQRLVELIAGSQLTTWLVTDAAPASRTQVLDRS
jgi:hypothetical protein